MGHQSSMVVNILVLALTLSLLSPQPPQAEAAFSNCNAVVNYLSPCFVYVLNGGMLPPGCCGGVKRLYGAAITTPDRRMVCSCIKSVAGTASEAAINRAAALPGNCGVKIPYKISKSIDCSKIK